MAEDRNVLGEELETCSLRPMCGFDRTGCCETGMDDVGAHVVCAGVTAAFLAFSQARGNDLGTPVPAIGFPGLKPGDRWCLGAARWREALEAGVAPGVVLRATHAAALESTGMKPRPLVRARSHQRSSQARLLWRLQVAPAAVRSHH